ncbi:hypothetical protein HOLleu_29650 [Holothuria leucospilota]|uniref:Uncharacterized protein n=1 Tax=Holothuria leucospilota TaxID=206669 RepID=A0A9Q1H1I2_HOLLE|nr:hypothetical protein HOLleu_29650 [Holothuria leucospilota]
MALVHNHSCECAKSELDLFTIPPTQTSIERGDWKEYRPLSTINTGGPIEFFVSGSGEEYIDLDQTQLYVRAKITKKDGSALEDDDAVGPVNLFLQSLFNQVDVALNGREISSATPTYPYRAMIETLLNYSHATKMDQLTSALFYKDTAGKMDVADPGAAAAAANMGLKKRSRFTNGSKEVELIGRLHSDIFCQEKYLLSGVDLRLKLTPSKDSFVLMSSGQDPEYRVMLQQVSLFVRKVKIAPSVLIAHAKALESDTAKYTVRRVQTKILSVPAGNYSLNEDHVFLGQLPKRIVIACVDSDAFNGSYTKNPFHFKHNKINNLALYYDGVQIPTKPLKPNFNADDAATHSVRSYFTLFTGTHKNYRDESVGISREDYPAGYTLFAFDFTPDLSDGGHFNLVKEGNLRLEMNFAEALPRTINVIVYAEFDNVIEIDKVRNISYDYTK